MTMTGGELYWSLVLAVVTLHCCRSSDAQRLCSVFQPFRVTPENAKFQIGGPFPLHTEDCVHVRPDVVQELIAVQWAISQWNQKPENANFKLAFSAFDTCSRGRESLGQTIAFLHDSGFLSPRECQAENRIPLGLVMSVAHDGRLNGLKETLIGAQAPLIAFSGSTAQALFDADVRTVFSTAPTIDHFVQATVALLKSMNSELVSLVYSDQHVTKKTLEKQLASLSSARITCSKIAPITDSSKTFDANSSEILIMIASKDEVINYFMTSPHLQSSHGLRKLFVIISALGETWTESEITDFLLPKGASYNLVIVQQGPAFDDREFRDYLLDILRNNFETYSLLATYMQQVYNCTLIDTPGMIDCGRLDVERMIEGYTANRRVESAVLATYVYAAAAKFVYTQDDSCAVMAADPGCTRKILAYLKDRMEYTFDDSDPRSYRGFVARFGPDRALNMLPIEGFFVSRYPKFRIAPVFNFTTGFRMDRSGVRSEPVVWSDGTPVKIRCDQQWRPECQQTCLDRRNNYAPKNDLLWIHRPADLYVLGLFDARRGIVDTGNAPRSCNRSIDNARSLSMPAAFAYALDNANKKYPHLSLLRDHRIGAMIFDSCHDLISTIETVTAANSNRCLVAKGSSSSIVPSKKVAALVSAADRGGAEYELVRRLTEEAGTGQQEIRKPFVDWDDESTGLVDLQSRALIDLLLSHDWNYVSILLSQHDPECARDYESFRRLVEADGRICISDVIHVKSSAGGRIELIRNANTPAPKIALAFTTARDTILALKSSQTYRTNRQQQPDGFVYILVGDAHDWEAMAREQSGARTWKTAALGALSVQPRLASVDDGFRKFLSELNPRNFPYPWFNAFWEDYFQCVLSTNKTDESSGGGNPPCKGDERLAELQNGGRMSREAYFMAAVEKFVLTMDEVYRKACPNEDGLCENFFSDDYYESVMEVMSSKMDQSDQSEFAVYNYKVDTEHENGGSYVEIGTWNSSDGLKLSDAWTWYDEERKANTSIPNSSCTPPHCRCKTLNDSPKKKSLGRSDSDLFDHVASAAAPDHLFDDEIQIEPISTNKNEGDPSQSASGARAAARGGQWKGQVWTYIFLVINSILLLAAGLVLTIVSVKLCCGIVKGNQSLGICLLFGVMLLYTTAYFFIFDPCEILCRLRYIAHSVSYSVCFGVMIAKAVQLRNSETLGFNGYISYWNYWLLLFFIVGVQIALNMQWAIVRHPVVVSLVENAGTASPTLIVRCGWNTGEFLASQTYVILLLCMALFMALLNRNVKRNYKETRWLLFTSLICMGIWALWMVAYAATPDPFKDTVVVMELIICATVVLCFMFGPKLYILLSYESTLIGGNGAGNHATVKEKLPESTIAAEGLVEKRRSIAMMAATTTKEKDEAAIRYFDMDDDDDDYNHTTTNTEQDGRKSASSGSSAGSGSGKSAITLCHTLSSASSSASTTTGSDGDGSIVNLVMMKKKLRAGNSRRAGSISAGSSTTDSPASNRSHKVIAEESGVESTAQ